MHHLLKHINQDITRRKSKDKDLTVNKTDYGSKRKQQVNPGGPNKQPKHQAPSISSIDKSVSLNHWRAIKGESKATLVTRLIGMLLESLPVRRT